MSLFETRTWWSVPGAAGTDAYDRGCLLASSLDGGPNAHLVTGSFAGMLRIYQPTSRQASPQDLLLEKQLTQAVLQLGVVLLGGGPVLIVLHPRRLVGYKVEFPEPRSAVLVQQYDQELKRSASCFAHGCFGHTASELLCVQSMDGALTFFNQDGLAFERYLPNFLLPGPLCYVSETDSFVTATPAGVVESYRYLTLASAADAPVAAGDSRSVKRVKTDWSTTVGEQVLDIVFDSGYPFIIVLGEQSIFWLKLTGSVSMCKRFSSNPSSMLAYRIVDDTINMLVSTHDNVLMVLRDTSIVWGAKIETIPVALAVAGFGGVDGLVATLDDAGALSLLYLGTDPNVPVIPQPESRDLMYDEMDAELRELQAVIRGVALSDPVHEVNDVIELQVQEPFHTQPRAGDEFTLAVPVSVSHSGTSVLENVCVQVTLPPFLKAESAQIYLQSLGPGHSPSASAVFHIGFVDGMIPTNQTISFAASYLTDAGEPRVVQESIELPLRLFCTRSPPSKSATHKITLATNLPVIQLGTLFDDVPAHAGAAPSGGNAIALRLSPGFEVTLVSSKSGSKYRLQSDSLPALGFVADAFCRRLRSTKPDSNVTVTFSEQLPLPAYFAIIDEHFQVRKDLEQVHTLLEQRAQQYRLLQKRLLVRFKDKTPAPLRHLDTLLEGTSQELLTLADTEEELQEKLARASNQLSCSTQLIVLLLRCSAGSGREEMINLVEQALFPDAIASQEQGWEEIVNTSLMFLLKTKFARSSKDAPVNPAPLTLADDTSKLKKQIAVVCERLRALAHGPAPPSAATPTAATGVSHA